MDKRPVLFAITFNGCFTANVATSKDGAEAIKKRLDVDHPADVRRIVPLYSEGYVDFLHEQLTQAKNRAATAELRLQEISRSKLVGWALSETRASIGMQRAEDYKHLHEDLNELRELLGWRTCNE